MPHNYTPGEWHVYENTVVVGNPKGQDVRSDHDPSGKICKDASYHDAKLISAAPNLLEACQIARRAMAEKYNAAECKILDDAISKAIGLDV